VRSDLGICAVGSRFYLMGGQGTKLFSDVRSLQVGESSAEWFLDRPDITDIEFESRMGHSVTSWGRYLIIFGGQGAFN